MTHRRRPWKRRGNDRETFDTPSRAVQRGTKFRRLRELGPSLTANGRDRQLALLQPLERQRQGRAVYVEKVETG